MRKYRWLLSEGRAVTDARDAHRLHEAHRRLMHDPLPDHPVAERACCLARPAKRRDDLALLGLRAVPCTAFTTFACLTDERAVWYSASSFSEPSHLLRNAPRSWRRFHEHRGQRYGPAEDTRRRQPMPWGSWSGEGRLRCEGPRCWRYCPSGVGHAPLSLRFGQNTQRVVEMRPARYDFRAATRRTAGVDSRYHRARCDPYSLGRRRDVRRAGSAAR